MVLQQVRMPASVPGAGADMEGFFSYDKEGFSVWRVDYKYGKELTETFMSSNLIRGFFTRLEASRKYLFGYLCVLGVKNDSLISGVFICRGKDIMPVVEVAPDWESYDFKPIDFGSALDKTFFEQAMAEELELEGKKWADGKSVRLCLSSFVDCDLTPSFSPPTVQVDLYGREVY